MPNEHESRGRPPVMTPAKGQIDCANNRWGDDLKSNIQVGPPRVPIRNQARILC
jgi:hypothetical protein